MSLQRIFKAICEYVVEEPFMKRLFIHARFKLGSLVDFNLDWIQYYLMNI